MTMKLQFIIWITLFIATASIENNEDSDEDYSTSWITPIGSDHDYGSFYDNELLNDHFDSGHDSEALDDADDNRMSDYSPGDEADDAIHFEAFADKDDNDDKDNSDVSYEDLSEENQSEAKILGVAHSKRKKPKPPKDANNLTEIFPPPYMITRINYADACEKEAKYYLKKYCPDYSDESAECCRKHYQKICKNGFRFYDSPLSVRKEKIKDGIFSSKSTEPCTPACKPYHSFVIASIKCRKKIRASCTYVWTLMPPFRPPPYIKLCCGLFYYKETCMPQWNDQKLYELPKNYLEIRSPICRLLLQDDFIEHVCDKWINATTVNQQLKESFAPPGLSKFDRVANCTIIKQSKEKLDYP